MGFPLQRLGHTQPEEIACRTAGLCLLASRLLCKAPLFLRLQVPQAELYRPHDFRRGHAKDLQEKGASVKEILAAGEWRSPAFLKYLDLDLLEHDLVVQAHLEDSSDED